MLKFFIAPLLGGIIGYITNDLAIKMLFRPRKSYYIGRWHIPFTPGLIPQQKKRIARSIGTVISRQLLNADTLKEVLLSDHAVKKLRKKIESWLTQASSDMRTVQELLELKFSTAQIEEKSHDIEKQAALMICKKMVKADIGKTIAESGFSMLLESDAANRLTLLLLDANMREITIRKIADVINRLVEERAPDIIFSELEKNRQEICENRICDIYRDYQDKQELAVDFILNSYVTILGDNLEKLLKAVDIEGIVVSKINSFDAVQLENMIFGIMKRELNAIVYLGAMLGFLMGFINLLF